VSVCYQTILQSFNLKPNLENYNRIFSIATYSRYTNCGRNFTWWFPRRL